MSDATFYKWPGQIWRDGRLIDGSSEGAGGGEPASEIKDLTLFDALHRLLTLALEKVRTTGEFAKNVQSIR